MRVRILFLLCRGGNEAWGQEATCQKSRREEAMQLLNPDLSGSRIHPTVLFRRVWRIFLEQKQPINPGQQTYTRHTNRLFSGPWQTSLIDNRPFSRRQDPGITNRLQPLFSYTTGTQAQNPSQCSPQAATSHQRAGVQPKMWGKHRPDFLFSGNVAPSFSRSTFV